MDYSQEFIFFIKTSLTKQKEVVTQELQGVSVVDSGERRVVRFPSRGTSEDENAQEVAEFSNRLTLAETLEKTLRDIESALKNIESGVYGVCKYCKDPIGEARLRARPASSSCIDCKKKLVSG